MQSVSLSESIEMYLKSLAELQADEPVAIARLAERVGVTQVSANEMVRRLVEQAFVTHLPYKGVVLTTTGKQVAYSVIRRQKLWECFLYEHLHMEWPRLYELACDLEHATAPDVTEALELFLGQPRTCPHGHPIPAADGSFTPLAGVALSGLRVGDRGRVLAILTSDTELFRYFYHHGLLPGTELTLLEIAPLHGPLTLQVNSQETIIGRQIAELVLVQII
ncbi:MAG: metal-dependent transcriptional regulator [Candidatus Promineifilaceae bacterium]